MHDLVIDNASIIDGLGGPARRGALAVEAGRIAAIGADVGPARERVDAAGLTLVPGIVDIHTHYDAQLHWDPTASPASWHGVTTLLTGNCGFTIAPAKPDDLEWLMLMLSRVEGMSRAALASSRLFGWALRTAPWQAWLKMHVDLLLPEGPSEAERAAIQTVIVAEAEDGHGRRARSRLRAPQSYTLTASTAPAIARRALEGDIELGFQTPGRAYGPDFALSFAGVSREDVE